MTTAADDTADEAAFEAFLAGRPVSEEAAELAAFAGAVRATATLPGRPNAALAELLATGLLTDQSSPSIRTAPSAGSSPRRSRVRRRRRFAMFFPALLAKFLSAGAVAQACSGAGIALVVATGAGATGLLGDDVQETVASVVGVTSEESGGDDLVAADDETTTATPTDVTAPIETTAPVAPTEAVDAGAWVTIGPDGYPSFDAWVTAGAHDPDLKDELRAQGCNFGSVVSFWARDNGGDRDVEGIEDCVATATATPTPTSTVDDEAEDADDDRGGNRGQGNGGGNSGRGNSGGSGNGNGNGNGNGRGHN